MADFSPPAAHPIIKIGPRGGLIVGQRTGKDGKPEYDYQRPEHQHIGAGPHREAPYRRPVQQSLFDAPRTLALKPPEEPRRHAAEKPQGDLFGAPRTVAVAHPAPPSGSRVAKLAKPLPWAAVQHHEPEPAPAPAPKAEWKAPEPTPAAAKLEGQTRERHPELRKLDAEIADARAALPKGPKRGKDEKAPAWVMRAASSEGNASKVVGPNGAKAIAYEWRWTGGIRYSKHEGGAVDVRVSDWDNAETCAHCGVKIVHLYWVKDPDGEVRPYGIEHLNTALGYTGQITESQARKLRQKIEHREGIEELVKSAREHFARAAEDTPGDAWRSFRWRNRRSGGKGVTIDDGLITYNDKEKKFAVMPKGWAGGDSYLHYAADDGWRTITPEESGQIREQLGRPASTDKYNPENLAKMAEAEAKEDDERRRAAGLFLREVPARTNPDEVTAAEQRQRQEAAEESARRRRKPEEQPEPRWKRATDGANYLTDKDGGIRRFNDRDKAKAEAEKVGGELFSQRSDFHRGRYYTIRQKDGEGPIARPEPEAAKPEPAPVPRPELKLEAPPAPKPASPPPAEKLAAQVAEREAKGNAEAAVDHAEKEADEKGDGGKGVKQGTIETRHLEQFKAAIDALNRRARRLGVPPLEWEEVPGTRRLETANLEHPTPTGSHKVKIARQVCDIRLIGEPPKLNGWSFLARVKQHGSGWIFKTAVGAEVPQNLRGRASHHECDHCNLKRDRKDVVIVRKDATGEHKTIGTSCVKDFLGGHNPEAAMNALGLWAEAAKLLQEQIDHDKEWGGERDDWGFGGGRAPEATDLHTYLSHVAKAIRENGWLSRAAARDSDGKQATSDVALGTAFPSRAVVQWAHNNGIDLDPSAEDRAAAREAMAWAKKKYGEADPASLDTFGHNLRTIVNEDYVTRDVAGMAASIVRGHHKETGQIADRKRATNAGYFGTPGEKTEADVRVGDIFEYENEYGTGKIVKMETPDGHRLTWFTKYPPTDFRTGQDMRVALTVKDHKARRGSPETIVTRVKVVGASKAAGGNEIAYRPPGSKRAVLLPAFKEGFSAAEVRDDIAEREASRERRIETKMKELLAKREGIEAKRWGEHFDPTEDDRKGWAYSAKEEAKRIVIDDDWAAAKRIADESGARMFERHVHPGVHFLDLTPGEPAWGEMRVTGLHNNFKSVFYGERLKDKNDGGTFDLRDNVILVVGHDPSAEPPPKAKKPRTVAVAAT